MTERRSASQVIRMQSVAEREVQRYAGDHALWHKHVHNVELDPMQVLKMVEMDRHPTTVDFSCRRTGKTAVKELYLLEFNACNADQEEGIVAPREAQALVNLNYHLEAIRRSPILDAYLDYRHGRKQLADTYYKFANRSTARAYGIMAQVDGGDLTTASLEEVDDMPHDRLFSRFLLMMGSSRRLGASRESRNDPQVRITGVFKGADTLAGMVDGGHYHVLPTVDVYLGVELGILNRAFMADMREQLSPDEYIRQLLCKNIAARNLIWEAWIRRAIQIGVQAGIELVEPMPGETYSRRGLIALGFDAGGHGEQAESSRHAAIVIEQIGNFACFPFAKTWPAGTDETAVARDLVALWRYFRPDYAMGDAYGVATLTQVNDALFREGLITVDRRAVGDGQSTASNWPEWAFSPIRFEGMTKHQMATQLRGLFNNGQAVLPYVEHREGDPVVADMRLLQRQLPNIVKKETKASYASYRMASKEIGDDLFDAAMAAYWALVNRGAAAAVGTVITRQRARHELLGFSPARLPSDSIGGM